ncbi:MAG TPA: hypothetical protein VLA28_10895, partial [Afifellaceae bacterium]|nr:hypothetical protein [Afifellaceae bacterium]
MAGINWLTPTVDIIDSHDRHWFDFWLGAIGDMAPVSQADRTDVQKPTSSGLRWAKIAPGRRC